MKISAVISLLICVIMLVVLEKSVQANPPADEIYYSQDFNSGSVDEWRLAPGWSIVPSGDGFALQGKGHEWAELNMGPWDNYYLQFRMNAQGQAVLHANIRKQGASRYFIGLAPSFSYISRQDDANMFHNELVRGNGIGSGWHTIRISADQGMVEVMRDGKKLMTYTDPDPLLVGGAAFENINDAVTLVDDVVIGTSTSGETAAAPSQPNIIATNPAAPSSGSTKLTWVRTGGPLGGLGYDVRMSPGNPDIMFVTDAKAGVFKSSDGGQTWQPANNGITVRTGETGELIPIFSLTISPTDPNLIWAGTTGQRGAFKSTDGGQTWKKMDNGITGNSLTLRGFAIDPKNNDIVYSAGELSSWEWSGSNIPGKEFDKVKGIVYKSTNGGQSWKSIWQGNNLGRYILIDPRDSNVVYLSTGIFDREAANSDWKTNQPGGEGLLKSTDGGLTWRKINNGLNNLYVGSLFMHPTNPDILLAGVGNNTFVDGSGVYISTNGGENWKQALSLYATTSVEIAAADPKIAYAGNFSKFYKSEDGGNSWHALTQEGEGWGPPGLLGGQPIDFQADPHNAQRLFANAYGGGNFLTEDGGQNWVDVSRGYTGSMMRDIIVDPAAPAHVYAVGRSGFFESRDGGSTWKTPNRSFRMNDYHVIIMDPANSAHLVVEINCFLKLAQSPDGGRTFSTTYDTPEQCGWRAMAFAPSDPSIIYAGSAGFQSCGQFDSEYDGSGFLRSTDGGLTWKPSNDATTGSTAVSQIAVHPQDAQTVYAATYNNGFLKTTDGGLSWLAIGGSTFPKSTKLTAVEISPWDNNMIFVGKSRGGLWMSTNAGGDWKRSSSGLNPEATVTDILFDPVQQSVLYLADIFSGVYRSENGGKTWKPINTGLTNRAVNKLAISVDGLHLYAASEGMGVFRLDLNGQPPAAIPEWEDEAAQPSMVEQQPDKQTAEAKAPPMEQPAQQPETEKKSSLPGICSLLPIGMIFALYLWHSQRLHVILKG